MASPLLVIPVMVDCGSRMRDPYYAFSVFQSR